MLFTRVDCKNAVYMVYSDLDPGRCNDLPLLSHKIYAAVNGSWIISVQTTRRPPRTFDRSDPYLTKERQQLGLLNAF